MQPLESYNDSSRQQNKDHLLSEDSHQKRLELLPVEEKSVLYVIKQIWADRAPTERAQTGRELSEEPLESSSMASMKVEK